MTVYDAPSTLGETVEKLREDLASLNIRDGEEWYALIGKGYDLCLESARFQPDHPNANQDPIIGRFACGAYAIRCLSVVARAMNALPDLLTALEQRGDGWLPIESAPEDIEDILLWLGEKPFGVHKGRIRDGCVYAYGMNGDWKFTYWTRQPLPPLPMKED